MILLWNIKLEKEIEIYKYFPYYPLLIQNQAHLESILFISL